MYQNAIGSDIGSLLRLIQEEKASQGIMRPSAEVAAPMRQMVQGPIKGAEDIGTSRIVGIKPEAAIGPTAAPTMVPGAVPARMTVGPTAIGGVPAGAIPMPGGERAPAIRSVSVLGQPSQVQPTQGQPSAPSIPTAPQPMPGGERAPAPKLATSINYVDPFTKYFGSAGQAVKEFVTGTKPQLAPTSNYTPTPVPTSISQLSAKSQQDLQNRLYAAAAQPSKPYVAPAPTPTKTTTPSLGQKVVSTVSNLIKKLFGW